MGVGNMRRARGGLCARGAALRGGDGRSGVKLPDGGGFERGQVYKRNKLERGRAIERAWFDRGQMTIELAVALPVLIAVAVIAVNAMTFFADCAVFDRVSCEAVRVHAASPSYGQDVGRSVSLIEEAVREQMSEENLSVSVGHRTVGLDFDEFTVELSFRPTLFGMGLRSQVFGVSLPQLKHEARYVVDCYKPGVVI